MQNDLAFFSSGIITWIIIAAIYVLFIAAEWRILTKAGEKGWKALIPIYNIYVSHHIVGMSHIWFVLEICTWIVEAIFESVRVIPGWAAIAFGIPTLIITILSELIHIIKMCDCFGKGTLFKIGMILVPNLFTLIIAFDGSKYQAPKQQKEVLS